MGFVAPHFPLIAPQEFFDLYDDAQIAMPSQYARDQRPVHPFLDAMRGCMQYDAGFTDDAMVRRAIRAYWGLTSFLDNNIGLVLQALEASGQSAHTRVVYSSDHGDNLGARGLWGKSTMYEESAGIPLILAGQDVPAGAVSDEAVSLVDLFPTIVQATGATPHADDAGLPGQSLLDIANGQVRARTVLSEYHALGAIAASYMIRLGRYKYVLYVGMRPMLFDLDADPQEQYDLGGDDSHAAVLAQCATALRSVVDPLAADRQARADQADKIAAAGGVDAILQRGTFRFSPPPDHAPVMYSSTADTGTVAGQPAGR